jgi:hypothetical protein
MNTVRSMSHIALFTLLQVLCFTAAHAASSAAAVSDTPASQSKPAPPKPQPYDFNKMAPAQPVASICSGEQAQCAESSCYPLNTMQWASYSECIEAQCGVKKDDRCGAELNQKLLDQK